MLSYQHGYHAGNFADVIKHTALTRLLAYQILKEKPFFYLETHAGKGQYDLRDKQAEKTGEYKQGIKLLWPERKTLNPVFKEYFQAINKLNSTGKLQFYPGSPLLAIHTLRAQDRAYFCELHSREFDELNEMPCFNKKVHFSNSDGIASLNALLPPPEKRGLIFIDPSFEMKEEYKTIPEALKQAVARFSTGVYCLWYPIVNSRLNEQLLRGLQKITTNNTLHIEFYLARPPQKGLYGCGLWIINPPFTFAAEMKAALETLKTYFNPNSSFYILKTSS